MKMMTVALVPCDACGVLGGKGRKEEEEEGWEEKEWRRGERRKGRE